MSNEPSVQEKVVPAKPRLLVEDRNAVVRVASSGEQTIVKVPSRTEEAQRVGVAESQI
jgi:hypothetical protein